MTVLDQEESSFPSYKLERLFKVPHSPFEHVWFICSSRKGWGWSKCSWSCHVLFIDSDCRNWNEAWIGFDEVEWCTEEWQWQVGGQHQWVEFLDQVQKTWRREKGSCGCFRCCWHRVDIQSGMLSQVVWVHLEETGWWQSEGSGRSEANQRVMVEEDDWRANQKEEQLGRSWRFPWLDSFAVTGTCDGTQWW